jgi:outer membrane protein assembly factor BamB
LDWRCSLYVALSVRAKTEIRCAMFSPRRPPKGSLAALPLALVIATSARGQSVAPSPSSAMFRGGPEHTGVYTTSGAESMTGIRWKVQTGGVIRGSPAISGGTVLLPSADGGLYAIDGDSGIVRWRYDANSALLSSPAVAHGVVIVNARDGRIHGIDERTGARRWTVTTSEAKPWPWGHEEWDYLTSSPVIIGHLAIVGSADGNVYAIDLTTGRVRWRAVAGSRIVSSPAASNGLVVVGGADGVVSAFALSDGARRWTHRTDGAAHSSASFGFDRKTIQSSPAIAAGTVFIGSRDGNEYALDLTTGQRRWSYSHGTSWVVTSPAVSDGRVFGGSSDGRFVHAIDASSGKELWRVATPDNVLGSPSVAGTSLLVVDLGGTLRALDVETGTERWRFRLGDAVMSSPVVVDDVAYLGSDDGALYALQLGGPRHRVHRAVYWDRAATPFNASPGDTLVRDHLTERGYEHLGDSALTAFLQARVADREPSVVVFAQDHVPAPAAPRSPTDTALLSRYLASGGSVVWLGWPPLIRVYDPATRQVVGNSLARPRQLLGILFLESSLTSKHGARPTPAGARMGLSRWRLGSWAVDPKVVTQALALDETGRAAAWTKSFGGPPGTGWIQLFALGATPSMLEDVRTVAECSLARAAAVRRAAAR